MEEFLERFEEESGINVFFALSVPDYENMSLNVAELRRYINQQKSTYCILRRKYTNYDKRNSRGYGGSNRRRNYQQIIGLVIWTGKAGSLQ